MPGAFEVAIGVESCQHSSVDLPCAAEIAVKFSSVGVAKVLLENCIIKRMKISDGNIISSGQRINISKSIYSSGQRINASKSIYRRG